MLQTTWAVRNNIKVQPPHLQDTEWIAGSRACIITPNETCKASICFLFTAVNTRPHSGTRYIMGISDNSKLIWLWRKGNHRMHWISTRSPCLQTFLRSRDTEARTSLLRWISQGETVVRTTSWSCSASPHCQHALNKNILEIEFQEISSTFRQIYEL